MKTLDEHNADALHLRPAGVKCQCGTEMCYTTAWEARSAALGQRAHVTCSACGHRGYKLA